MNGPERDESGDRGIQEHLEDRPDLSSLHVREDLAMAGRCANVHLPTGRTCFQPERHQGSCEFVEPQDAEDTAVQ